MSITIYTSSRYSKNYQKLIKKRPQLIDKIDKQLTLLRTNPQHPSLKLHKLQGRLHTAWSVWIEGDVRILFVYIKEGVLLVNIGSHQQVY